MFLLSILLFIYIPYWLRYERIYLSASSKTIKYNELHSSVETLITNQIPCFTDITLTPVKAIFSLECEILEHLLKALIEIQQLKFLQSLTPIYGAHTRLTAWESKMQNREVLFLFYLS